MGQAKETWGLYRVSDKKKFEEVSLLELKFLYRALPTHLHNAYLFWDPRSGEWTRFQDFRKTLQGDSTSTAGASQLGHTPGPHPSKQEPFAVREKSDKDSKQNLTQSDEKTTGKLKVFEFDQTETSKLSLDPRASRDSRNEVRYDRRFRVRIFTPSGPVKNATLDASMKGLKLEHPLPTGLPDFFHVEVQVSTDKRVSLLCSAVKEKGGEPAHRLKIHKNDNPVLFKAVLFNAA